MKILTILISVICLTGLAFAEDYIHQKPEDDTALQENLLPECPHWQIKMEWKNCKDCHVLPSMKVKKEEPYAEWDDARPYNTEIKEDGSLYLLMTEVDPRGLKKALDFATYYNINEVTIEMHGPGGSLFEAQRAIGIMEDFQSGGGHITTIVRGFAASAHFLMFIAGNTRLVDKTSILMWHELKTFSFFKLEGPSNAEENSRVLRLLQDNVNQYVASRSSLTKEEVDKMIEHDKELWCTGTEAVEKYKFADGFVGCYVE